MKLHRIAELYAEMLDQAARNGTPMLHVLAALIGEEVAVRRQRAVEQRMHRARLPKRKTLSEYDFNFPKRIPKQAIPRLFDCDFVAQHGCAVFIGPTGTGKSHLLGALGYTACEKGISRAFHPRRGHDQHPDHGAVGRYAGEEAPAVHPPATSPPR
jgi:DNA replication protein DnaC